MITPESDYQAPLLRTEFELASDHGRVAGARWLVSALGVFEASIGAERVSDDVLSPGWSAYEWRLRYRVYDVTERLQSVAGPLVLGLSLGNGWYRGKLTWFGSTNVYGDRLGAIAELEITFTDGYRQLVVTDPSWTAGPSAVLVNDLYDGQTIDGRLQSSAWLQPGFSDPGWAAAEAMEFDTANLVPYLGPPVVRQQEIAPVAAWTAPNGRTLVDFGQNVVGWLRLRVKGAAGTTITVRHAEVLEGADLGVRPLRTAEATDRFILSGGWDVFEPTFTFHGFRYAEIDGWPDGLSCETNGGVVAVVVSSDVTRIGTFECSDLLLNKLHENVVWSQRGNFLDVPTDCPQRDERLGWTGDIAVFAPTAAFLFDVNDFLHDWLLDLRVEQQHAAGLVPFVVPDVLKRVGGVPDFPPPESTAIWSDAAIWVPCALWWAYGKRDVIVDSYPAMRDHLKRVECLLSADGLWDKGFQFGDWLDPDSPPEQPFDAKADKGVVATACLYRSAVITADFARILGRATEAAHFDALADRTRRAFTKRYVQDDATVLSDCTTVYALAIAFDLLDEPGLAAAGERLAALVEASGYTVTTGFAGTPYICDALTRTGHLDAAYRLLTELSCPSWLYPVTMGATTIWERWDAMLPDGAINPGEMTSFNHYALGAVADWMHRTIGGLSPAEPGYSRVRVAPRPGGGLRWARATLQTPHGRVAVHWETTDRGMHLDLELPAGVTADVVLPGEPAVVVGGGRHSFAASTGANAGSQPHVGARIR